MKKRSTKERKDAVEGLVEELRDEDGIDPRYERHGEHATSVQISDLRLASQMADAITLALSETSLLAVTSLRVVQIMRVGRGSTFAIRLAPEPGAPVPDLGLAQTTINALAGHLRAEVSRSISRKHAPHLRFEVVPEGGWDSDDDDVDLASTPHEAPELEVQAPPAMDLEPGTQVAEAHHEPGAGAATEMHAPAFSLAAPHHSQGDVPLLVWNPESRLAPGLEEDLQAIASSPDVHYMAVMPDIHRGKLVPNGLVIATEQLVYPEAVGADIGCGVLAVKLGCDRSRFDDPRLRERLLREIIARVPVLKRTRHHAIGVLPDSLRETPLSASALEKHKSRDAVLQIGSMGRGNHFVELQAEPDGGAWLMIHTGSRGIGQAIFEYHSHGGSVAPSGLFSLDTETDAGRAYLRDMDWAIRYAGANREAIAAACDEALHELFGDGLDLSSTVNVPHNFLRREEHFGRYWWVHRKSALSAASGERSLVPGSMAGPSFHVTGRGSAESLQSCAHGAGRRMSRTEARKLISPIALRRQMRKIVFNHAAEEALVEEAPAAYKNPREVMRAQRDLVRTVRQLEPLLNYKAP